jgi:propane monooxygenase reductase subunit
MAKQHTVTVAPAGLTFLCGENETILDAGLRQRVALPNSCRNGGCGTCKARICTGEADSEIDSIDVLTPEELDDGYTLLCSAYALTDLTVDVPGVRAGDLDEVPEPGEFTGRVTRLCRLTHDIWSLTVALDRDIRFRPGQFMKVNVPGTESWRSYSIANSTSRPRTLDFMIKEVPGGEFSRRLACMTVDTQLRLNGPHGSFWVRDGDRPLLLIGGGAGMAPLWGILQSLAESEEMRPVRYFYGARTPADLFHLEEMDGMELSIDDFSFVPALSESAEGADRAPGRQLHTGLVTDVVERVLGDDLGGHDAYLCGPPGMIDASIALLERHGLAVQRNLFFDKFTAA